LELFDKNLNDTLYLPEYEGNSLVNLSNSILNSYGIKPLHNLLNFDETIFNNDKKNIVLIVIDALGYYNLLRLAEKSPDFSALLDFFNLKKITSVFPTTTSVALTSLVTGTYPIEHGIMGYLLFLERFNSIMNMINLSPIGFPRDIFVRHGLNPNKFLPVKTIFQHLTNAGIKNWTITSNAFKNSGLTRMHHQGSSIKGYSDVVEMIMLIKDLLEKKNESNFIFCYWGLSDMYGHIYGTESEEYCYGIELIFEILMKKLLKRLDKKILKETLFLITGDHGQINTSWRDEKWLNASDEMTKKYFVMPPTGDTRSIYLNTNDDTSFKDYFRNRYDNQFTLLTKMDAVETGLFGDISKNNGVNGIIIEKNLRRIGKYIALAHSCNSLNYKYTSEDRRQRGKHGSLNEWEVFVPLLIYADR